MAFALYGDWVGYPMGSGPQTRKRSIEQLLTAGMDVIQNNLVYLREASAASKKVSRPDEDEESGSDGYGTDSDSLEEVIHEFTTDLFRALVPLSRKYLLSQYAHESVDQCAAAWWTEREKAEQAAHSE